MKTRAFSLNICNIYTAAWCLYLLQGSFYSKGGPIGRILIILILSLSLFYFVKQIFIVQHQPYLRALSLLVIMFTIYGLIAVLNGTVQVTEGGTERTGYDFIKQYYISILPIFAYYSFAKDGFMSERWFSKWVFVFFGVAIVAFFTRRSELLQKAIEEGIMQTEFTNNHAYLFVALIPVIALVSRKSLLQWLLWLVVVAFSLFSFKRGAILTTGICFLFYIHAFLRGRSKRTWQYMIFAIVVATVTYIMFEHLMSSSDYFMYRLERTQEGSMSDRDELYSAAWHVFTSSNAVNILFGHGASATSSLIGNGAHNDWLEILVCQGVLGVSLFAFYWITLLRTWLRTEKGNIMRVALGLFVVASFLRSIFSFSIGDMSFYTAAVVGYCLIYRN